MLFLPKEILISKSRNRENGRDIERIREFVKM